MTYLSDYLDRLYEPPDNAQAGYRYSSVNLVILHVTSVPQDDWEAIAYMRFVEKWYPKTRVMIIEKRAAGQQEWKLMHHDETAVGRMPVLQSEPVLVPPVPEAASVEASPTPGPAKLISVIVPPPVSAPRSRTAD